MEEEKLVPTGNASVCDIYTLKRHHLPPLSIPRANHAQCVLDASNAYRLLWVAYALGGFDGSTKTAAVERYVLGQKQEWEVMKPMLLARSAAAAVAIDRSVFALGGRVGYSVTNTCEKMHTQTDDWQMIKPMRQPRCCFSACTLRNNSYIVVAGGWDGSSWIGSCEAYDLKLDVWRAMVNLPSPKLGYGLCVSRSLPADVLWMPTAVAPAKHTGTNASADPTAGNTTPRGGAYVYGSGGGAISPNTCSTTTTALNSAAISTRAAVGRRRAATMVAARGETSLAAPTAQYPHRPVQ